MKRWEYILKNDGRNYIEGKVSRCQSFRSLAMMLGYAQPNSGRVIQEMHEMIDVLGIDTSHFTGHAWNKDNIDFSRFQKGVSIKTSVLRNALLHTYGHECMMCMRSTWMMHPIPLEVHHLDGDNLNNTFENLALLCPNCHRLITNEQLKTNHQKVSDDELSKALMETSNIRAALLQVGLAAKGGNYERAKKLYSQIHGVSRTNES